MGFLGGTWTVLEEHGLPRSSMGILGGGREAVWEDHELSRRMNKNCLGGECILYEVLYGWNYPRADVSDLEGLVGGGNVSWRDLRPGEQLAGGGSDEEVVWAVAREPGDGDAIRPGGKTWPGRRPPPEDASDALQDGVRLGGDPCWRSLEDARFIHLNFRLRAQLMGFEQDLQSEIESHRDVFSSLNGTGRKLLSSLASQDDAVMLQRRLDEMNQRWHHLKAKSMAIR
uniref:Dystrophin n=1 Tax=Timema tahoe TaxID=61484 RepID=A0A7R9ID05_9NEOP|nr:unnamed protein product [Timema tahoe]